MNCGNLCRSGSPGTLVPPASVLGAHDTPKPAQGGRNLCLERESASARLKERPLDRKPPVRQLLVIAHAPSPNTRRLLDAVLRGATHPDVTPLAVRHVAPLQAVPDDVLGADALILGTTENLG